ncbi:MAG: hypothetical protein AAGM67_05820 [Bacteroidota bacterium]
MSKVDLRDQLKNFSESLMTIFRNELDRFDFEEGECRSSTSGEYVFFEDVEYHLEQAIKKILFQPRVTVYKANSKNVNLVTAGERFQVPSFQLTFNRKFKGSAIDALRDTLQPLLQSLLTADVEGHSGAPLVMHHDKSLFFNVGDVREEDDQEVVVILCGDPVVSSRGKGMQTTYTLIMCRFNTAWALEFETVPENLTLF